MFKAVLLGAGDHCGNVHAPSLAHYAAEHPGELILAAVCDRREDRAQLFCERYGFARPYTDLEHMLEVERPDGCWVVVPVGATRTVVGQVLERGVPVLFEKPPGASLQEAQELAEIATRTGTPNQVAFNRRYAPCTQQALTWAAAHGPWEYLSARMLRFHRAEANFAFGTGIHLLDCVRALAETAGRVVQAQTTRTPSAAGAYNFYVDLQLGGGGRGRCEILPTSGRLEETYALYGNEKQIIFSLPWAGEGVVTSGKAELWAEGKLVESETWPGEPTFLSSGFYQETAAFVAALREGCPPTPNAQQSVASVALAEAVQAGEDIGLG